MQKDITEIHTLIIDHFFVCSSNFKFIWIGDPWFRFCMIPLFCDRSLHMMNHRCLRKYRLRRLTVVNEVWIDLKIARLVLLKRRSSSVNI